MPIKLKANNGNIDLKAPIKQVGGAVDSVNGMTGDVVLEIPSKTSDLVNDSGFITQIPDEYVTETELDAKGYLTEHQSLADYAKKSEIPDVSGFLTEIPSEYVTETELEAKGYLTQHQSLAEYAKKSELFSKDYNDLTNKPTIPSVEGLASTQYVDEKVATKQDTLTAGNNITIVDGVISATGGEPDAYIKEASVSGNTLTLTKKDNSTVAFTPEGGSGGGSSYTFTNGLTETDGTVSWDLNSNIQKTGNNNLIIPLSPNESYKPKATGKNGINIGINVNKYGARGMYPILIGQDNETSTNSIWPYCFGTANVNDGRCAFCIGLNNEIITDKSSNTGSVIIGSNIYASGEYGNGLFGVGSDLLVNSDYQFVQGKYNIADNSSTYRWIFGIGYNSARANGYTLDGSGNGTFAGTVSSSTGADYAEYFEWKDGNLNNEDRVGYIVCLDGDKIVKANTGDDILGICSGTAMVLGDSAEWNWSKRYLTDDFGRIIYEDYDVEHEEIKDEETGKVIEEAWTEHIHAPKQNPEYDVSQPYTKRADRPEWQIVGMMGKLYVRDDGSCVVNGYADVKDGIATKATGKTNMRVMARVNENIVRVLLK